MRWINTPVKYVPGNGPATLFCKESTAQLAAYSSDSAIVVAPRGRRHMQSSRQRRDTSLSSSCVSMCGLDSCSTFDCRGEAELRVCADRSIGVPFAGDLAVHHPSLPLHSRRNRGMVDGYYKTNPLVNQCIDRVSMIDHSSLGYPVLNTNALIIVSACAGLLRGTM